MADHGDSNPICQHLHEVRAITSCASVKQNSPESGAAQGIGKTIERV